MSKETFKDYCESCEKETDHEVVEVKLAFISNSLKGSKKVRCQECGYSFQV